MNKQTTRLTAALATSIVALTGFVAPSFAQAAPSDRTASPNAQVTQVHARDFDHRAKRGRSGDQRRGKSGHGPRTGMGPQGGIFGLACSKNGASRIENRVDGMADKLNLSDSQKPLFDTFRTQLLTAQTTFADSCGTAAKPAQKGNLADRLAERQSNMKARLAATDQVLPAFTAFYNSLDADQLAKLRKAGPRGKQMRKGWSRPGERSGEGAGRDDDA